MKLPVLRMPGMLKRRPLSHLPPGTAPGTLITDPEAPPPRITVIGYGGEGLVEEQVADLDTIHEWRGKWAVTWINIDGVGHAAPLQTLAELYELHPLALEDVLNVHHHPKLEEYAEHLFAIVRMPTTSGGRVETEQLSIFLGADWLISFQERPGDCLDPVRARMREPKGKFRTYGADYLAYAIIDAVIDSYFPVLELVGERLEDLEGQILEEATGGVMNEVQQAKRDLLALRRGIWPQREFLNTVLREPSELLSERTQLHLRDTYDHAVRIVDLVDTYREIGTSLTELYMSTLNNRMSDVMKVLTVIATIFIPLTFIAGIYGMNFDPAASRWNMPELAWRWGYPFALGVMAAIAIGLVVYFRRKGWIGRSDR